MVAVRYTRRIAPMPWHLLPDRDGREPVPAFDFMSAHDDAVDAVVPRSILASMRHAATAQALGVN